MVRASCRESTTMLSTTHHMFLCDTLRVWLCRMYVTSTYTTGLNTRFVMRAGSTQFTYLGCFKDDAGAGKRALPGRLVNTDAALTAARCRNHCAGYRFFGLQIGKDCWCGHTGYNRYGRAAAESECATPCKGDGGQACGSHLRNSVYQNNGPAAVTGLSLCCLGSTSLAGLCTLWLNSVPSPCCYTVGTAACRLTVHAPPAPRSVFQE